MVENVLCKNVFGENRVTHSPLANTIEREKDKVLRFMVFNQ